MLNATDAEKYYEIARQYEMMKEDHQQGYSAHLCINRHAGRIITVVEYCWFTQNSFPLVGSWVHDV